MLGSPSWERPQKNSTCQWKVPLWHLAPSHIFFPTTLFSRLLAMFEHHVGDFFVPEIGELGMGQNPGTVP